MPTAITVFYPRKEGGKFDLDYYLGTHMKLVMKYWADAGLKGYKIINFSDDAPYTVGAVLDFESLEAFQKATQLEGGKEIMADIAKFSSETPVLATGDVVATM